MGVGIKIIIKINKHIIKRHCNQDLYYLIALYYLMALYYLIDFDNLKGIWVFLDP